MICKNCNKMIPDGRNFCPYCGNRIVYYQETAPTEEPVVEHVEESSAEDVSAKESFVEPEDESDTESMSNKPHSITTKDENSSNKNFTSKHTKYLAIIAILAVLLCSAVGFIIYQNFQIKNKTHSADDDVADNTGTDVVDETAMNDKDAEAVTQPLEDSAKSETALSSEESSINQEAIANTEYLDISIPRNAVTFEGHSYYIFDDNCESWNEAKERCEARGGYLAVINTLEENEFLYRYMLDIGYDEVFFGYTDQDQEERWEWVSGKSSDFLDWGINEEGSVEPNSSNDYEDYAHMNSSMHNGHWNDKKYGQKTTCYFCEWDAVSFLENEQLGKTVEDGTPIKNNALDEADTSMRLDKDKEIKVLYCLTKDNGETWYYVQYNPEITGYIKSYLLELY